MKTGRIIIKRPILTEKMSLLEDRENKYAFEVDPDANKLEIKKAIEKRFGVKVNKIAVLRVKGKSKSMTVRSGGRVIRTRGRRSHWKKAIITLREGDSIDLFEGEAAP
ncbi:MAG: 50S ribosomal protein L23 [Fidelibacterota bacterium]